MMNIKRLGTLLPFLIGAILFIGGLGYLPELTVVIGGILAIFLLLLALLRNKKLSFPKGFWVYGLFLLFFLASLLWSLDWWKTLSNLALFLSGGVFWVVFFNLKEKSTDSVENIVLVLGIIFGIFALAYKYLDFAPFGKIAYSLVFPATDNHHHIGDFWAITTVIVIHKVFVKKKYLYSLLFIPASAFLVLSLSKSAYLTLLVGTYFIFYFKGWIQKYQKVFAVFIFLAVFLFLFAGIQKSTLFSRPYFFQAATGVIKHPFGVGYGNFGTISSECFMCFNNKLASFSSLTHNIVLEVLAGMGILGLSFIFWLYQVSKDVLEKTKENNLLFTATFFALLANFFFDFTYVIPSMFWLWFIFLGIAQKSGTPKNTC